MENYKFELDQSVKLKYSNESGVIIGKAKYLYSGNHYYVVYKAGDGRQITAWWEEDLIEVQEPGWTSHIR